MESKTKLPYWAVGRKNYILVGKSPFSTIGGKYYGVQFYVEEKHDPNEYDNDDCHYYFDVCRSVAIRRYNSEINKINRILKMLAKEYGFDEVYCSAVFGNGEAIYTKVENTQRARIVRAIKEIA